MRKHSLNPGQNRKWSRSLFVTFLQHLEQRLPRARSRMERLDPRRFGRDARQPWRANRAASGRWKNTLSPCPLRSRSQVRSGRTRVRRVRGMGNGSPFGDLGSGSLLSERSPFFRSLGSSSRFEKKKSRHKYENVWLLLKLECMQKSPHFVKISWF